MLLLIRDFHIDSIPSKPKLLAWCSFPGENSGNKISITKLETKQRFADFDGVNLNDISRKIQPVDIYSIIMTIRLVPYACWSHVKELSNTGFLVSLQHCCDRSANLEVFDVSQKGRSKKIYSFEEVYGGTLL